LVSDKNFQSYFLNWRNSRKDGNFADDDTENC